MNGYRVHLTRLSGGFASTVTVGDEPDENARIHVADGLDHSWGFEDEYAPNPMEPSTVQFRLVARTAADLPALNVGDLWTFKLDLVDRAEDGTVTVLAAGAINFVGRLGEPEAELVPQHSWPVRVALVLVDPLADLRSRFPPAGLWDDPNFGAYLPDEWLDHWAVERAGINTWYPDRLRTDSIWGAGMFLMGSPVPDESAFNQLARMAASTPGPDGQLATTRWRYDLAAPNPAVYRNAGASIHGTGYRPDPTNPICYVMQDIGRSLPDAALLPYQLTGTAAGPITLALTANPAAATGIALLDAQHVTVPTTARRSRDQQPNTIVLGGKQNRIFWRDGFIMIEAEDTTLTVTTDASAPRSRSADTLLVLREIDDSGTQEVSVVLTRETRARLEKAYTPDVSALADEWVYDRLKLDPRAMTTAEYTALVPMLTSAAPGERDGVALRQVVVTGLDPDIDLSGRDRIAGRLVAGGVRIEAGRLTYELQLAPGVLEAGASAITAAQLAASPRAAATPAAFGNLTALDMRLVRA